MIKGIRVRDIMKTPVITANIDEPFSKVEEKFRMKGIRHLPVVDAHDKVVGLITQRDLYKIVPPHRTLEGTYHYDAEMLNSFILKYVMTKDPVTLFPDDYLASAVEIMARQKFGCIPIVDSAGKIAGILTETDILKFLARTLRQ